MDMIRRNCEWLSSATARANRVHRQIFLGLLSCDGREERPHGPRIEMPGCDGLWICHLMNMRSYFFSALHTLSPLPCASLHRSGMVFYRVLACLVCAMQLMSKQMGMVMAALAMTMLLAIALSGSDEVRFIGDGDAQ